MASNSFALVMIVRDEEPNIRRCLESVRHIMTSALICDTGSKDHTIQVIQDWLKEHHVPGKVIEHPWEYFGPTKTFVLKQAREDPDTKDAEYFFWLDADEVYTTHVQAPDEAYPTPEDAEKLKAFLDEHPSAGIFNLATFYGNYSYFRPNIVRNDQLFWWKYPLHEQLRATREPTNIEYVPLIQLYARHDGNSSRNPQRYWEDLKQWEAHLKEHPDDDWAQFYYAQGLEDVGLHVAAIPQYIQRIKMDRGWNEYRYISALRIGRISNEDRQKIKFWKKAIEINPQRLEAYHELVSFYLNKTDYTKAYAIAITAPRERNGGDRGFLFAEPETYDWRFDMQSSLAAYYSGHYAQSFEIGRRIINRNKYPERIKHTLIKNMEFFSSKYSQSTLNDNFRYNLSDLPDLKMDVNIQPTLVVIDNFLADPDSVRNFLLSNHGDNFVVKGNYPGSRTRSFATFELKSLFEKIIQNKITYWPDNYNGAFQYTTEEMVSWIHRDQTDWGAILYLTPGAPENCGMSLYKHKNTGIEAASDPLTDEAMNFDSYKEDAWILVDQVGNKYNRLIIFNGRRSHRSTSYFGKNLIDGRLFQTFFFNTH